MPIDEKSASDMLGEIRQTIDMTQKLINYRASGYFLIIWGIIVAIGFIVEQSSEENAALVWTTIRALGVVGGFVLATALKARRRPLSDLRLLYAFLAATILGWCWTVIMPPENLRALDAHWTMIFMFALVISGIWIGRMIIFIGLSVMALTVIGYFVAGPNFHLWMAACNGIGLIASGLWLRSMGLGHYVEGE